MITAFTILAGINISILFGILAFFLWIIINAHRNNPPETYHATRPWPRQALFNPDDKNL